MAYVGDQGLLQVDFLLVESHPSFSTSLQKIDDFCVVIFDGCFEVVAISNDEKVIRDSSMRCWKISPAGEIQNGMHNHFYRPKGVLKVVSLDQYLFTQRYLPISDGAIHLGKHFGLAKVWQNVFNGLHWVVAPL